LVCFFGCIFDRSSYDKVGRYKVGLLVNIVDRRVGVGVQYEVVEGSSRLVGCLVEASRVRRLGGSEASRGASLEVPL